jgi:hypothetical protein
MFLKRSLYANTRINVHPKVRLSDEMVYTFTPCHGKVTHKKHRLHFLLTHAENAHKNQANNETSFSHKNLPSSHNRLTNKNISADSCIKTVGQR